MADMTARTWIALVAICMAFFVIQLDATIVNVALPAIQRSVGGSLGGLQWVVDAYALPLAAVMLTAGSSADRRGARRVLLAGFAVFTLGSAACAWAPALPVLIAARVVQGLGAAALLPCSLALIVHLVPDPRARARALGVWGGIGSLGMAAGPVLGGALVTLVSWRLIFLVNVPLCLVTAVLAGVVLDETPRSGVDGGTRPDVAGMLLGMAALGCLAGGFIEAGQAGWTSPLALGLLALGVVWGVALVGVEHRRAAPMLPLGVFRISAFSAAVGVGVLFNFCLYGSLLCLSLFLQHDLGLAPFSAGLTIMPLTLSIGIGATASGRLTARFGPLPPMLVGLACAAGGALVLSAAGPAGPPLLLIAGELALGLCSLAMPAMTSIAVGALGAGSAGLAGGVLNAARQMGGALGVAVLGALLASGRGLLHVPLLVTAACYAVALGLAWLAGRRRAARPAGSVSATDVQLRSNDGFLR